MPLMHIPKPRPPPRWHRRKAQIATSAGVSVHLSRTSFIATTLNKPGIPSLEGGDAGGDAGVIPRLATSSSVQLVHCRYFEKTHHLPACTYEPTFNSCSVSIQPPSSLLPPPPPPPPPHACIARSLSVPPSGAVLPLHELGLGAAVCGGVSRLQSHLSIHRATGVEIFRR